MKNSGAIVGRYATAMLSSALQSKEQESFRSCSAILGSVLTSESLKLLQHPALGVKEKLSFLREICAPLNPTQTFMNSLAVLVENRRGGLLVQVLSKLRELLNSELEIQEVSVTSAVALSVTEKSELESSISACLSKKIILSSHVKSEVLAGVVIKIGNSVVDASLASQLQAIKESLSQGA